MASAIIFFPLSGFLFCFFLGYRFSFRVSQIITTTFLFFATLFSWIIFFKYLDIKDTEIYN